MSEDWEREADEEGQKIQLGKKQSKMEAGETARSGVQPGWLLPTARWRPSPLLPGPTLLPALAQPHPRQQSRFPEGANLGTFTHLFYYWYSGYSANTQGLVGVTLKVLSELLQLNKTRGTVPCPSHPHLTKTD